MKASIQFLLLLLFISTSNAIAQPQKGETVPDIVLQDSSGNKLSLYDLNAKLILVDFWASWCAPCRKSNKMLRDTYQKFGASGFEIFGVSIDQSERDWRKAIVADKILWKQVVDTNGWDGAVAQKWKIELLPTSFLINEKKQVIAINPSHSEIERLLKEILK